MFYFLQKDATTVKVAIPSRKRNVRQFTKYSYTFEKTQFKTIDETYIYLRENEQNMTSYQQLHRKNWKISIKTRKIAITSRKRAKKLKIATLSRRCDFYVLRENNNQKLLLQTLPFSIRVIWKNLRNIAIPSRKL